eukprot:561482-Hanusia_phi.AAC.2
MVEPLDIKLDALKVCGRCDDGSESLKTWQRRISEGKLRLEDKLLHVIAPQAASWRVSTWWQAEKKTSKFSSSIAAGLQQLSAALQKSEEEFDDKLDKARSSFAAAAAVVKAKE